MITTPSSVSVMLSIGVLVLTDAPLDSAAVMAAVMARSVRRAPAWGRRRRYRRSGGCVGGSGRSFPHG